MKNIFLIVILLITLVSCDLPTVFGPPVDWHYDPPQPVEEPVDTIPVDTIPVDTVPPCTFPEVVQEPPFVIAYHEITDVVIGDRVIIVGNYSETISPGEEHLIAQTLDSLWELYRPEYSYKTYVSDTDDRILFTLIKGTNDRQQFYLKEQIRYNGFKHYAGFDTKAFMFGGAATAEEFSDLIDEFPSVWRFNFRGTNYSAAIYVKLSLKMLGECKKGDWADFRFNPVPIPDSIITMFENSQWNTILHGPEQNNTIDLRGTTPLDLLVRPYDVRHQIITRA